MGGEFESQPNFANPLRERALERQRRKEAERNWEKFQMIFSLFGTDEARKNFKRLLGEYYKKYHAQKHADISGWKKDMEGRASLHNQIIDTFKRLAITVKPGSEEQQILWKYYDRENFHDAIKDYMEEEAIMRSPPEDLER